MPSLQTNQPIHSSFQLDDIIDFKPHIAVLLNITPDHLDRYDYKFENYIESKFRIAMNQTKDDYLIYDADDEVIIDWLKTHKIQSTLLPFSLIKKIENVTPQNIINSITTELNWGAEKLRDDITCLALNIRNTELAKQK